MPSCRLARMNPTKEGDLKGKAKEKRSDKSASKPPKGKKSPRTNRKVQPGQVAHSSEDEGDAFANPRAKRPKTGRIGR